MGSELVAFAMVEGQDCKALGAMVWVDQDVWAEKHGMGVGFWGTACGGYGPGTGGSG